MNKRQKHPDALADRRPSRTGTRVTLAPIADRPVPSPPANLHPVAQQAWLAFFSSPISGAIDLNADWDAVCDWGYCLSQREELRAEIKRAPMVSGSTGQMVLNPLTARLNQIEKQINYYREHLGLTPLSRMRLGIAVGQAADALDSIESLLAAPPDPIDIDALLSDE